MNLNVKTFFPNETHQPGSDIWLDSAFSVAVCVILSSKNYIYVLIQVGNRIYIFTGRRNYFKIESHMPYEKVCHK